MSADVIALADRRRPPATDPFFEPCEVVHFDLGRRVTRPVVDQASLDAVGETTADRIERLECHVTTMRETNSLLLETLVGLLAEVRELRLAKNPATDQGAQP